MLKELCGMNNFKKPKLWIVTELFYPDQASTSYILSKIADKMIEKYDVSVITNSDLYQKNKPIPHSYFSISNEIKILRVTSKQRDKNNLIQRTIKLVSLSFKLSKLLWNKVTYGEKVLIVTNPAPLMILIALIKKIKKIKLFILVHDVFPENTVPLGIIKSPHSLIYKSILFIFNKAYSSADYLIVLGRDMKKVIQGKIYQSNKKPKILIIENWGDVANITPALEKPQILKERHANKELTIQYAGNIGRLQGLDYFIEVFKQSKNKNLYLDIWGDGALKDKLIKYVEEIGLTNKINFFGNYSREEQNKILNYTDIALVTLSKGMYGLGVPSKTYNILAAGKPILFIGDLKSEIALLIQEESIGYCFSTEDKKGVIEFLNNLTINSLNQLEEMGKKARIIAERKYSEDIILSKFFRTI